jgi:hypothetical protein
MAHLQSTTISGSNANTGSLQVTGSTVVFPIIESSLTSSFSGSGKMWINADTQNLQYSLKTSLGTIQSPASFMGAWAAGGIMPSNKGRGMQAVGVQNAALAMGGVTYPGGTATNTSDEYNGTSWASGPTMDCCGFQFQAAGIQNAALAMGMYPARTQVRSYDGSSWSNSTGTPVGVRLGVGGGFQNAAWVYGQFPSTTATLHWNGSSWSSNATIGLSGNQYGGGVGTIGAALSSGASGATYAYDGIVWSKRNPGNSGLNDRAASGQQDAAVYAAGRSPQSAQTEEWNGLSWVRACDIPVASDRGGGLSGGNSKSDAGLAVGGYLVCQAYEYTKSNIVPYTTNVWTSGAGNILDKSGGKGAGDANAALSFGGTVSPARVTCTEEYDGTSWSAGGAMIIAVGNHGGTGTANAALSAGGEPATCTKSEEYNGSTWATGGNLSQGGYGNAALGTQNDAINFGGNFTGKKAETYNGSSWSTISDMNCCRRASGGGAGTTNTAIVFGGRCYTAPTTCQLTLSEEWNGSSWSFGGSYSICASDGVAGGQTVNTALSSGGYNPANPNGTFHTELYDGTSWSAGANALDLIKQTAGHSIGDSAFATGGNPQSNKSQFYEAFCSTTLCNAIGAWSVANNNITPREARGFSGQGTQNAVWLAGGRGPGLGPYGTFNTELYDGTTWTTGNDISFDAIARAGTGTQNAGLLAGGFDGSVRNKTEEFDGSTWSNGGSMSNSLYGRTGAGIQNDALVWGGSPTSNCTEEYNGTSWSTGGAYSAYPSGGKCQAGIGASVNDVLALANNGSYKCVRVYDGTSWSAGTDMNTCRNIGAAAGTTNAGMAFGGSYPTATSPYSCLPDATEFWNGSTWSIGRKTNSTAIWGGGAGSQTAAIFQAGNNPSYTGFTEEFTCTLTGNCVGAWSIGGDLITARFLIGGFGTQNAGAAAGGGTPTRLSCNEEYNGSTWSAGGALITGRSILGAAGTQNEGVAFGGGEPTISNKTEEYNGTSWASSGNMITAREDGQNGMGTQNAALTGGGSTPSAVSCTEEYNGSTWSSGGNLITARTYLGGAGTQNAGVVFGGSGKTCTEEYNGSSWSASGALLIGRCMGGGTGDTQDAAVAISGYVAPTFYLNVERYNGIAWSTEIGILHPRWTGGSAGSQTSALYFGGSTPSVSSHTEEFNCNTLLGAGLQCFIANVTMETE